ncbi:hypothetical protein D0B54_20240 [Solimonas sp. K1W22B-7]|uniref:hypothetical protein n=1 Tax=Solimonas sp. K1W22B-7 TaxID=2303331 RepID=UPI000E33141A|nr:hypothetical protein [Solimonas sp. K1W22B-7]AXQ30869.1 hypothetical protein D0B54_20240 [Solimonas sp. K1W22B-7]
MLTSKFSGGALLIAVLAACGGGRSDASESAPQQARALGNASQVNQYSAGDQQAPAAAGDAAGNVVVAWDSVGQDGSLSGIYARRLDSAGNALGNEFRVNTRTDNRQILPAVAMSPDGRFAVAWNSNGVNGVGLGIYVQRYAADGTPQGGEIEVAVSGEYSIQPGAGVAMDPQGNFIVLWADRRIPGGFSSLDTRTVQVQRYSADGSPKGGPVTVEASSFPTVRNPTATMDAAGNFVVAWVQGPSGVSKSQVFARRIFASGLPRGFAFRVSENNAQVSDVDRARIAGNDAGAFVVVWEPLALDASSSGAWLRVYNAAGQALRSGFRAGTNGEIRRHPTVSMNAGGFVVAGHGNGVWAQRYDLQGNRIGTDFRPDTSGAPYTQLFGVPVLDSHGGLTLVWQDWQQDGDGRGISSRRYAAP